jgi:ubiquinone/menaquinone biosynthesis C-methylase UbiE
MSTISPPPGPSRRKVNKILENDLIRQVDVKKYQAKVRDVYDGPQGAVLATLSALSLHTTCAGRLLSKRKFDLRGAKNILDAGCGAGQIAKHLLKYSDGDADITCCDLSPKMVERARRRMKSRRPSLLAADVTRLPFPDERFDCVTFGYALEHLPDPLAGLVELRRVMQPGGRMLLLTCEENFGGACTSRLWCSRTFNRPELRQLVEQAGFVWKQELWFSKMHQILHAGGICVALEKPN